MPLQIQHMNNVNAALISKGATLTAKKILKEVIQEAAMNQAANLAVMEAMDIANKYQAKDGFKIVCTSGGSTCDKPVQVKTALTDADKTALRSQTDIEFDKLVSPNGKGFSKFQNFLDWFLPIWLVTFAMTALTYAMDEGFRSLLNEAAYNSLVALGFIIPIDSTQMMPIDQLDPKEPTSEENAQPDTIQTKFAVKQVIPNTNDTQYYGIYGFGDRPLKPNYTQQVYFETPITTHTVGINTIVNGATTQLYSFILATGDLSMDKKFMNTPISLTVQTEAQTYTYTNVSQDGYYSYFRPATNHLSGKQIQSIRTRLPYEVDGFWYFDVLFKTVQGDVIYQAKATSNLHANATTNNTHVAFRHGTGGNNSTFIADFDSPLNAKVIPPNYDDVPSIDGVDQQPTMSADKQRMALIPPTAITYKEEATGETVNRVPNANGDGAIFQKPDGTEVPEENIVPNDAPKITTTPEGKPQVVPEPTPSNPNPEPIPLTPGETVTDPNNPNPPPPTTTPEEPPLEPFPEGEKCDAKLQFPIFSPLKEQFSTSFPFSIPWDIGRAIDAGFSGIGNEKPSYTLDLAFMGGTESIDIKIPDFFDDWIPFVRSVTLFTFDVMIMFGIYRFVKGAGS